MTEETTTTVEETPEKESKKALIRRWTVVGLGVVAGALLSGMAYKRDDYDGEYIEGELDDSVEPLDEDVIVEEVEVETPEETTE